MIETEKGCQGDKTNRKAALELFFLNLSRAALTREAAGELGCAAANQPVRSGQRGATVAGSACGLQATRGFNLVLYY